MKLNHECVRDTLLYIEENYELDTYLTLSDFLDSSLSSKYSKEEIIYCLLKLAEAEYIIGKPGYGDNILMYFNCTGLTWEGHQFLDNIRDPKVWRETKDKAKKLTSISLTMLSTIGSTVITKMLGF